MDKPIKIAIKGALSTFQGFGDYIASSPDFSADPETVKAIDALDQELCAFYDKYPDSFQGQEQLFCLTCMVAAQRSVVVIRACKRFTQFPDRSRYYDRREYFFAPADGSLDQAAIVTSLPGMQQFAEKQLGGLGSFPIHVYKASLSGDDFIGFIRRLRNRETILLNAAEAKHAALDFVHQLPPVYRQYLSFALNIQSSDPWVTTQLHLATCNDVHPSASPKIEQEPLFNQFCKELFKKDLKYSDEELATARPEKSNLWDLINYHWLHYAIDSGKQVPGLRANAGEYVNKFATAAYAQQDFIAGRIKAIYLYWDNHDELDVNTFFTFWQRCQTAGGLLGRLREDDKIRDTNAAFIEKCLDPKHIRDSQTLQQLVERHKQFRQQKWTTLPAVATYFDAVENLQARPHNKAELLDLLIREKDFFHDGPIQKWLGKPLADPGWKETCSLDKMQAIINAYPQLKDSGFIRQVLGAYDLMPVKIAIAAKQLMDITDFLGALLPAENPTVAADYGQLLAGALGAIPPADQQLVIHHLFTTAPEKNSVLLLQTPLWPALLQSANHFDAGFLRELKHQKKRWTREPNGAILSNAIDELIQTARAGQTDQQPAGNKNRRTLTTRGALLLIITLSALLVGSIWWHWSDTSSANDFQKTFDSLQTRIQFNDSVLGARNSENARLKKELDSLRRKTAESSAPKDSATAPQHHPARTRRTSAETRH